MKILDYFTYEEAKEVLKALEEYTATFPNIEDSGKKVASLVRPLRAYMRNLKSRKGWDLMLEICCLADEVYRRLVPDFDCSQIFWARLFLEKPFDPREIRPYLKRATFKEADSIREDLKHYFWIEDAVGKQLNAIAKIESPLLECFFIILLQCLLRDLSSDCSLVGEQCSRGFYIKRYLNEEQYYYKKLWNSMKLPGFKCWVIPEAPAMRRENWDWHSND